MDGLLEYYEHTVRYISRHFPFWSRSDGADHFWWNSGDGAGCNLNEMGATRRSIGVAHYFKFNSSSTRCGLRTKDVAVPPYVPQVHTAAFLDAGRGPTTTRPLRFFFAGNVPDAHQARARALNLWPTAPRA